MNLRIRAKGQECQLRLPNVCNGVDETVVLAHLRRGNVAGVGQKPPDICALPLCSSCHDVVDHRSNMGGYTADKLDGYILEGLNRWLAKCWAEGWVKT